MPNESQEPTVRLHTTIWLNAKRALKDFAKEKWLSSTDEALNRFVEFYSPTDSKELANHVLFHSACALESLPDPDDRTEFFRFLYEQLDGVVARGEDFSVRKPEAETETPESKPEEPQTKPEEPKTEYRELPFLKDGNIRLLKDRKPFSAELTRTNFRTLKNSADNMGMSVGELIDLMALGYPDINDPIEQGLGVMTYFCVGMSRLSRQENMEAARIVLDILEFVLDALDGTYTPEDAKRIRELLDALDESQDAEVLRIKKWKYDNSVIATFVGFFPDLFGPET